jgi:hypothetical protein
MKGAVFLTLLFCSCGFGRGFVIKEKIVGNYYLVAADIEEDLSLSYHVDSDGDNWATVVDPTVFAVGYNEKYIFVKQHPRVFPNLPDKRLTNYFILPLKQGFNWKTKNGLIGPLSETEFERKRIELGIQDDIPFSIEHTRLK